MKKHIIKHGGDFTVGDIDDTFTTYCGLNESHDIFTLHEHISEQATCKRCLKSYIKKHRKS